MPRRLTVDGEDCASEAILLEKAQRFKMFRCDPQRERYLPVDLFTFEGPLIHRSVAKRVGAGLLPSQSRPMIWARRARGSLFIRQIMRTPLSQARHTVQ